MRLTNVGKEKLNEYINNLSNYVQNNFELKKTLYLDLGVKTVRVLIYNEEVIPHIEKQTEFVLRDKADKFDDTIIVWKDPDIGHLYKIITPEFDPKHNIKRRVELIANRRKNQEDDIWVFGTESQTIPVIQSTPNTLTVSDSDNNTYYYGVKNLEPEEFIKDGHIFVMIFNRILKTENTNIAHGAVAGFNNNGVLFCARGQRGKSTLTVLSMIRGFEYVSDDYLTLEKEGDKLYSYPIYSIITLSPRMYNELYGELKNCHFVSNNARKDKYVFNISTFHNQFKVRYPISLCIFPEIVSDKEPSIKPCTAEEKGRAMVQLIHSTTMQMQDMPDTKTVKKLFDMLKDFEFLKLNLCSNIEENTRFLREFLNSYKPQKNICEFPEFIEDITFDIANIINTKTYAIYTTNKFGTMLYQNLKRGVTKHNILTELKKIKNISDNMDKWLDNLLENLLKEGILESYQPQEDIKPVINEDFIQEECYYPMVAKNFNDKSEMLIEKGD